jgi:calcium/calmodulin-dependent protein kinase I
MAARDMARTTRTVERRRASHRCPGSSTLPPSASSKFSSATSLSSTAQAAATQAVDITRDVALKAIPKKKVKGNEESVWGEMRFLQGLDHPNIVRPISPRAIYLAPSSLHTARALMF